MTGGLVRQVRSSAAAFGVAVALLLFATGLTAGPQTPASPAGVERLAVLVGRSIVLPTPYDVEKCTYADPDVMDVLAVSHRELVINGKKPGTTSLLVWAAGGRLANQYEVVISDNKPTLQQQLQTLFPGDDIRVTTIGTAIVLAGRVASGAVVDRVVEIAAASGAGKVINLLKVQDSAGVPELQQQMKTLFPNDDIQVLFSGQALILSGRVSSAVVSDFAAEIATKSAPDKKVVNLLQPRINTASQQVMLQVRFAEVSRSALLQLGVTLLKTGDKNIARVLTTQQSNQEPPAITNVARDTSNTLPGLVVNDFLNLFFFQRQEGIGAIVKALQTSGSFESLAEPNLIAYNGKPASFLAGGEIPIAVPGGNGSVTVEYKKFGIGLEFTPFIDGDVIHLHVAPEVSAPDFANGVILKDVKLPLLNTRRAATDVELHDGQSFAIAGLLDQVRTEDKAAVPLLSKIPVIGRIFQSKSKGEDRKELLVLITAQLVQPLNPDQLPALPKIIKK